MVDWRLGASVLLSVGLHACLFFPSVGKGWVFDKTVRTLSVFLPATGKIVGQSPHATPRGGQNSSRMPIQDAERGVSVTTAVTADQIFVADELDVTPQPIFDPVVEPDYGFADDVEGSITLKLLVDAKGYVVFDLVEENDLDEPTTKYLRQQFRSLQFKPPTTNGKRVYAWLTYVVTIRRKENQ